MLKNVREPVSGYAVAGQSVVVPTRGDLLGRTESTLVYRHTTVNLTARVLFSPAFTGEDLILAWWIMAGSMGNCGRGADRAGGPGAGAAGAPDPS